MAASAVEPGADPNGATQQRIIAPQACVRDSKRGGALRDDVSSKRSEAPPPRARPARQSSARACRSDGTPCTSSRCGAERRRELGCTRFTLGTPSRPAHGWSPAEPRTRAAGHHRGLQNLQGADCDRALLAQSELHRCASTGPVQSESALTLAPPGLGVPSRRQRSGQDQLLPRCVSPPRPVGPCIAHSSAARRRRQADTHVCSLVLSCRPPRGCSHPLRAVRRLLHAPQ
jgi:hypothetical protein